MVKKTGSSVIILLSFGLMISFQNCGGMEFIKSSAVSEDTKSLNPLQVTNSIVSYQKRIDDPTVTIPLQAFAGLRLTNLPTLGILKRGSTTLSNSDLPLTISTDLVYETNRLLTQEYLLSTFDVLSFVATSGGVSKTANILHIPNNTELNRVLLKSIDFDFRGQSFESLSSAQIQSVYFDFAKVFYDNNQGYYNSLLASVDTGVGEDWQEVPAYFESLLFKIDGSSVHLERAKKHLLGVSQATSRLNISHAPERAMKAFLNIRSALPPSDPLIPEMRKLFLKFAELDALERTEVPVTRAIRDAAIMQMIELGFPGELNSSTRTAFINSTWNNVWPAREGIENSKNYNGAYWYFFFQWMSVTNQISLFGDSKTAEVADKYMNLMSPVGNIHEFGDGVGIGGDSLFLFMETVGAVTRNPKLTRAARMNFYFFRKFRSFYLSQWGSAPDTDLVLSALEAELIARKYNLTDFGALATLPELSKVTYRTDFKPYAGGGPTRDMIMFDLSRRVPDKVVFRSGAQADATTMVMDLNNCKMGHGHCESMGVSFLSHNQSSLLTTTPYLIKHFEYQNTFQVKSGGANSGDFSDRSWNHVVIVREKSGSEVLLKVYVNGQLAGIRDINNRNTLKDHPGFLLGCWFGNCLNGKIDQVGFYRKSLTSTDIGALFTNGRSAPLSTQYNPNAFWDGTSLTDQVAGLQLAPYDGSPQMQNGAYVFNGAGGFYTQDDMFRVSGDVSFSVSLWFQVDNPISAAGGVSDSYNQGIASNGPSSYAAFGLQLESKKAIGFTLDTAFNDKYVSTESPGGAIQQPWSTASVVKFQNFESGTFAVLKDSKYLGQALELKREVLFLKDGWIWIRDVLTSENARELEIGPAFNTQRISGARGANWFITGINSLLASYIWELKHIMQLPNPRQDLLMIFPNATSVELTNVQIDSSHRSANQPMINHNIYRIWNKVSKRVSAGEKVVFDTLLRPLDPNRGSEEQARAIRMNSANGITTVELSSGRTIEVKQQSGQNVFKYSINGVVQTFTD